MQWLLDAMVKDAPVSEKCWGQKGNAFYGTMAWLTHPTRSALAA